ncbi:aspartyl/glutamyl-tRNA(Asn/Gln) amidotransferase subunit A [Mesomycoplasma conjunctivae]|uniref:Glutamyl-tRNA amidotransferase subunit A n=1 Tax=Mesomycoplasma conjunctivae (strain ATCC 25834 / NCTC 10147 / HRC/581) TaxID=572263 RepID=C5J5W6_MESCH|nr:amidase family protein [Mesomycoplasma conjunctivae]CAT04857.1 Glutamyl-tRNA amidotransferase subunit A [Mesomycoplasma conjunctivae]VEU65928.1 aspartyl/glutamyl-tRNA(Asn/Gln) amidotransferase subunit A [Mesomycoplasma conjunctivae]
MIKYKYDAQKAKQELAKNSNSVGYWFTDFEEKSGSLTNSTFSIKENFATSQGVSHGSSKSLINFQPSYNATIFEKLVNAGAKPLFKTHNDELGLGGKGLFSAFGEIYNPLDASKLVGGSSSGSAATLNYVSFAIASDTGDSIRRPASFIGKVGFKPTYGAVSRYGLFSYATSLDTVGWLSHNVADSIEVAKVAFGRDEKDLTSIAISVANASKQKPKKIAVFNFENEVKSFVNEQLFKLIDKLRNEEIEVEIIKPDTKILSAISIVYKIVSYAEVTSNLSAINGISFAHAPKNQSWEQIMFDTRSSGFGLVLQKRLIWGSYFLKEENQKKYLLKAKKVRRIIANYYKKFLENYDIVIFPSYYSIAPDIQGKNEDDESKITSNILTISNLTGNPSLSIPLGKYQGLPFNITIDANLKEDEKLLSFALYIEEKIGEINE